MTLRDEEDSDGAKQRILSRRHNPIVAWHEVPGKAPSKEPSRRVRYDRTQLIPEVFLVGMDRFQNLRNTVPLYPTGRPFRGGAVPGTSCQATIARPSGGGDQNALHGKSGEGD